MDIVLDSDNPTVKQCKIFRWKAEATLEELNCSKLSKKMRVQH